ncbi:NAD(P)/FAD-dependent oxidoreductase [Bacteriovoracaceae bacterium]|nr:NAD(P)/FAD-dependent oxidoreductase [Bacteriovoracaceae bacterium]
MEKIIISGAGLVGSLLAVTLCKKGFDVEVHEKRSDMRLDKEDSGRSINLVVTSRGLNAVSRVGLLEDVLAITIPVTGRMMHSKEGELTYQAYGRDDSECNYSISRSQLNKLLMTKAEEAGAKIIFESELMDVDIENNTAKFSTGEVGFTRIFGTDGAASPTRRKLIELTNASESVDMLESDYKELFMPAKNGEYAIEKNALHIWPRGHHMFMALPNLDGSFTMTLYMDQKDFSKLKTPEDVLGFFKEEYGDSVELMPGFEKEFFENPQGRLGTVRLSKWYYQDKIVLLGDAAHAIVPFFGQGMNCGFEDCFYLDTLLEEYGNSWGEAFKAYDHLQRPNGHAIADMALENFIEMRDKVGQQDFLFRKKVESELEKQMCDTYRARYGMVTYTLIPYQYVQEVGLIQQSILEEICQGKNNLSDIDWDFAHELVKKKYIPFMESRNLTIERYKASV